MSSRFLSILLLVVLGIVQFLVVPIFPSQALGGKVALFSFFVIATALCMIWQRREWVLPWPLAPLVCLAAIFLVSLSLSAIPGIGIVELGTFATGLLFCFLVANLSYEKDVFQKWTLNWLQTVGLIIAVLCLYQYLYWVLFGPRNSTLIPYLLPPGSWRVNGVYGQSNLTALVLLATIIAFLPGYASKTTSGYSIRELWRDAGFLLVSVAFFLTHSRAGNLAFFCVAAILVFLIRKEKLVFTKAALLRILFVLLAGFVFSQLPLSPDVSITSYSKSEISVDGRFVFWVASVLIFLKFPLLGAGLDHFKLYLPAQARPAHDILGFVLYDAMGYSNWAHNEYLQVLAESGVVGFLFLAVFCILLVRLFLKETLEKNPGPERPFLFLLIIPFFVQGLFSWPFRHPALLFIFFLILGTIFAKTSSGRLELGTSTKMLVSALLLASLAALGYFSHKEYRFVQLKKEVKENGCGSPRIIASMNDQYLGFKVMREVLPMCATDATFLKNRPQVEKFRPYFERIADLQGTHSQWYNLAVIYRNLDDYAHAEQALEKAVDRQPEFELGWATLHSLHVENAARQTGRPIQDFLPPESKHSADYYDSVFKRQ